MVLIITFQIQVHDTVMTPIYPMNQTKNYMNRAEINLLYFTSRIRLPPLAQTKPHTKNRAEFINSVNFLYRSLRGILFAGAQKESKKR